MSFGPSPDSWVRRSTPDTHFAGSQADGVIAIEDITSLPSPQVVVSRITLLADENLSWEVSLWKNNTSQPNADQALHGLVDFVIFSTTDGIQHNGTGPFVYSLSNMAIRWPADAGRMIVGLTPRGATKTAGAAGTVTIELSGPVV